MRILFFSYAYPNPLQPQLGTFNRTMIAGLARRHDVRVIAPVPFTETLRAWGRGNTCWRSKLQTTGVAGVLSEHPTFWYPPKVLRSQFDRFLWWSVRSTLERAISDFRPDVVLSYWTHPDGAVAVRAARAAELPVVVMAGGSDILILGRTGTRRQAILNVLHAADAVVTVSDDLATTLREDGIEPASLHVVPRGIDQSVFHPGSRDEARDKLGVPKNRPVLVGVGRLVAVKDWDTWIDACAELVHRGLDPSCHILGSGPLESALRRNIADRGLEPHVTLQGAQSQAALANWYRAADLTVLSSRSEGIPNVLLETLASGGSFVATNVGGIPEIADPIHDRLVPVANPRALAAAIVDRLRCEPPAGLPRRFTPLTQADAAERLSGVLEQAVSNHGQPTEQPHPCEELTPCLT